MLYVGSGPLINRGVEKYITSVISRIDHSRFIIDIFTPNTCENEYLKDITEQYGGKVIEGHGRATSLLRELDYYKLLSTLIKNGEYDIIEIQTGSILHLGLGIHASRKNGHARVVAHSHNTQNSGLKAWIKQTLFRTDLINADAYFSCSEKAGIETFPKSILEKVIVVNNAIDTIHYTFSKDIRNQIRESNMIPNECSVFGFVGALTEQKNPLFLIDVFKRIHDINKQSKLWVIGDGELRIKVEEKIRFLGLDNDVKLFGNREDVNNLMQGMDCCIIPSLFEGLCIVAIEAQAAGLPVLASDVLPENVEITDLISFVPLKKNVDYWAQSAIQQANRKTRIDTSQLIRKAGYDIDEMVGFLSQKYETLLSNSI